jgi:apolipoprotein N-acyltransferase
MVVFRAIENRRSIARAANTGISALIDATGEIKTSSTLFTETLITGTITMLHLSTFYTTYGDVFAYFSTLFSAIVFLSALIRKSNHEQGRNL